MKKQRVLIAGGGLVGLAFAIALAQRAGDQLTIELLEAKALPTGEPDPMDTRATALNLRSVDILSELGVWAFIKDQAATIQQVHVSNQRRFGSVLMRAQEIGEEALGYVAENHLIGRSLLQRADALGISLRAPVATAGLDLGPTGPGIVLDSGDTESGSLVVLADGGASTLRDSLGIGVAARETDQVAIVANVTFSGPQAGTAYERFTGHGPLALLPLPSVNRDEQRFNLVWSMHHQQAEELNRLEDGEVLGRLQAAFGWRLGRLRAIGRRNAWPLVRTLASEQSRPGYLVAGNAAHTLHPVAGQGFNLSLRDADVFARCVVEGMQSGHGPGSRDVLRAYEALALSDQSRIVGATDALATLFNRRGVALDLPRDAALAALDLVAPVRRSVAAMGTGRPLF